MKSFVIILCLSLVTLPACDCEDVRKAELFIKKVTQLFDYYGQPIINFFTGQPVTVELPNAIFYNLRTGEYFNPEFGPTLQTLVGDVIQFMTSTTNSVSNLSDCQTLAEAPATTVNMPLDFTFPNGQHQLYNILGNTSNIPPNQSGYGAGAFQILGPGNISVNQVQIDPSNRIDEFNENNNVTQIGVSTEVSGRRWNGFSVTGKDGQMQTIPIRMVNTGCALSEMEIFRNLNGEGFSTLVAKYEKRKRVI